MPLPPLRFEPIFKPAIWGGNKLRPLFGIENNQSTIGEAWLLSDVAGNTSMVAEGPLRGTSLRTLMRDLPERMLGKNNTCSQFPLHLKLIDANQNLSVQVHPNDALAKKLEGPGAVGKTEAWVILDSTENALIHAGLIPGTTAEAMKAAIQSGEINRVVACSPAIPGDCYYLRAGTVHAIGAGTLLFEVQQPSDITYRLFDWGRLDAATGQPRTLHLDKGLQSINYEETAIRPEVPTDDGRARDRAVPLVDCPYFKLRRRTIDTIYRTNEPTCRALVCAGGNGTIKNRNDNYSMKFGDVWLISAETGECTITPNEPMTILECAV